MKITSPDCRCHLSVKRHRRVEYDSKNFQMVGHFYVSKQARTIIVSEATGVTAQALYNHKGRKC